MKDRPGFLPSHRNRNARWVALLGAALLSACASPVPVAVDENPASPAVVRAGVSRSAPQTVIPSVLPAVAEDSAPDPQSSVASVPEAVVPLESARGVLSQTDTVETPDGAAAPAATTAAAPPLARGMASWYGSRFHGRRTASGERYDMNDFTAAHKTLPFGTRIRVRSVHTGQEVVVRINDRGPYTHRRIVDLSRAAMAALGTLHRGVTEVELLRE